MFITEKILDLVVKTKDEAHALALAAFNQSHEIAVGALRNEVVELKKINEALSAALRGERSRADGLVDRLLVRDAKVAAVAPAAIAAATHVDEQTVARLREAFSGLADVGEVPPASEHRAFEIGGGSAVLPSASGSA